MKYDWSQPPLKILAGILLGIPAGFVAILFFKAVSGGHQLLYQYLIKLPLWGFGIISLAIILMASFFAAWLTMRWAPLAGGSGISQMKLIYWRDQGFIPWKATVAKIVACGSGLIAGIGLGRRGPSVFICAGIASLVADLLKFKATEKKNACAAGAAAGLAACFNTPLAAVTFFLEEVLGDLNSKQLGIVLLASIMGAGVFQFMLGNKVIYPMDMLKEFQSIWYLPAIIVGLGSSLLGMVFTKSILLIREKSLSMAQSCPFWLPQILGAMSGWLVCFIAFAQWKTTGLFGTGDIQLNQILGGNVSVGIVWGLLILKLISVCLFYGTGGCGGIFGPLMFLGGACGYAIGSTIDLFMDLGPGGPLAMAGLGMCACFGSVVKAPITGILMLFEMTHSFELLPSLMLVTLISQAISNKYAKLSIYDELLVSSGHNLERHLPARDFDEWHRRPIATIANLNPVSLHSLKEDEILNTLETSGYDAYPLLEENIPVGVLSRKDLERSLSEKRNPYVSQPISVHPATSIQETQTKLLNSRCNIALIVDSQHGRLLGLVSMRDILRKELNRSH